MRKTAAICVAKLFDINPELVEDRGFIDQLRELLADNNPMVVANAVAALAEIRDSSRSPNSVFCLDSNTVHKLLAALNECTEWGQVFILDSLSSYTAKDERDALSVIERVTPRLQHANCAVVLSAVKVIIGQLEAIHNPDTVGALIKKLAPPLVTLLSAEAEIQYVALRNINLVIQRYPEILQSEIKVFFCKYNDPIYVKQEKLETIVKLAAEQNIEQVLLEFKEYATEVDVDFVRKAVRAIGRCAISIESAAERCISVLLELIGTKVNYVVQEAIVVIKDIFRRYPNQYEGIIGTLCEALDTLDEPEAKASMIWIIGEYAERIDNAEELLEAFLETFLEEAPEVQLQLLTAAVKLFLKKPSSGPQALIQTVLNQATTETDDPDLRDRAYIYWRLLSSDPEAAKEVVLASKPMICDDRNSIDAGLLQALLGQISTLSSVYYKLPSTFVPRTNAVEATLDDDDEPTTIDRPAHVTTAPEMKNGDLLGELATPSMPTTVGEGKASGVDLLADLMDGLGATAPAATTQPPSGANDIMNVMDLGVASVNPNRTPDIVPILLQADKGAGLQISGVVIPGTNGTPVYNLTFTNHTQMSLDGFQLQFNKNTFRLAPASQPQVAPIGPGESRSCQVPLSYAGQSAGSTASSLLQVAVKSPRQNQAVFYFNDQVPLESVLLPDGHMDNMTFMQQWQATPNTHEQSQQVPISPMMSSLDAVTRALCAVKWFLVSQQPVPGSNNSIAYLSGKVPGPQEQQTILLGITFAPGVQVVKVAVRERVPQGLASMVFLAIQRILSRA